MGSELWSFDGDFRRAACERVRSGLQCANGTTRIYPGGHDELTRYDESRSHAYTMFEQGVMLDFDLEIR